MSAERLHRAAARAPRQRSPNGRPAFRTGRPRWETAEQRRIGVRDELLLAGADPAAWPNSARSPPTHVGMWLSALIARACVAGSDSNSTRSVRLITTPLSPAHASSTTPQRSASCSPSRTNALVTVDVDLSTLASVARSWGPVHR